MHEVETSDDGAVLIREAACQSADSAGDEYPGLRVDKELRHRCCLPPCGIGGNPIVDISRLARQRHFACPLQCRPTIVAGLQEWFRPTLKAVRSSAGEALSGRSSRVS